MRKIATSWGVLALMCLFAFAAFAGDVNGKWKYETETPNGKREGMLTLKSEGGKLTGSITGRQGETPISDGKITGDDISFSVTRGERKIEYKGKLVGDDLKLNWQMGDRPVEVTAKRSTT